ncbi:MAG: hypothetical protein JWR18_1105 [Segetibacter sp.]|nr:hypothetical protein [Segetibacter sp.]
MVNDGKEWIVLIKILIKNKKSLRTSIFNVKKKQ